MQSCYPNFSITSIDEFSHQARMASSSSTTASNDQKTGRSKDKYQLTVNSYDRTATLIIALLVLVSMTVLGLLIIYFAKKTFPPIDAVGFVPVEASSPNTNQGISDEPDPPGAEDAPELTEPQLQDTLDALTSAVSAKEVMLSDEVINADAEAGKGKGLGDARMAGPGGDGVLERVPRWERWKIRFEPESQGDFASWLDYHKIEIGILGRDNLVHYATDLSAGSPQVHQGPPNKESRGYTSAADGPMPTLTIALARKADITRLGTTVLLFYPNDIEELLYLTEKEALDKKFNGTRDANAIRQTVFTVVKVGSNYTFEVIDQKYF
jgi:hypothetical protein